MSFVVRVVIFSIRPAVISHQSLATHGISSVVCLIIQCANSLNQQSNLQAYRPYAGLQFGCHVLEEKSAYLPGRLRERACSRSNPLAEAAYQCAHTYLNSVLWFLCRFYGCVFGSTLLSLLPARFSSPSFCASSAVPSEDQVKLPVLCLRI